jgi:hypothetical protein
MSADGTSQARADYNRTHRVTSFASSSSPSPRVSILGVLLALVGVVVLVATVRQVGWADIRAGLSAVGLWFVAVVGLGGVRFLVRALAWTRCARQTGATLSVGQAFAAGIAADAVGNLTPLGLLASEPTKVLLVRGSMPTGPALASVALDNAFYTGSVVVMLAAGAWMLVRQAALPPALTIAAEVVLVGVLLGAIIAVWAARRRPAVLSWAAQHAARMLGRATRSPATLQDIESRFYGVVGWPATALGAVAGWQAAFHVAAVAEVWIVLSVLSGGQTSLADAFIRESTGRLITVLFKVVPFRVGVDEAGAAVVAAAVGVPVSHAVALALVRKLRILVWNGAGLAVLARARR